MAADHAASGGLVRDELYLLFLSAVFSGGAGGFILPDTLEKTVVGAAGRQLFLLLDGLRKNDCFSADHNRFGLSGSSGYGGEQQAFDSVRKSLEKEERKTRKAVMMRRKRYIVFAMVLINVGLLAFLKYYHFFSANINALGSHLEPGFSAAGAETVDASGHFFLYAVSGGLCDRCLRGQTAADHHFGRLALFLSLFTNITEGPISRYDQLAGQAFEGHRADYRQFTFGAQLILWGLFQKMVLADRAALLVSTVFGSPSDYSGGIVILAMFVYTLQIYADFCRMHGHRAGQRGTVWH